MSNVSMILFGVTIALYFTGSVVSILQIRSKSEIRPGTVRLTVLAGWICQTALLAVHCANSTEHRFSSPFEILLLITWSVTVIYIAIEWICRLKILGAFALPLIIVLLIAAIIVPGSGPNLPDSVQADFHLALHIFAAVLSYAGFFTAMLSGLMFLVQERQLKTHNFGRLYSALPSLEAIDRAIIGSLVAGVVLLAFSIGVGAINAGATGALGPDWFFGRKTLLAIVTWLFFVGLTSIRLFALLRGRPIAYGTIGGFALVLVTFLVGHGFS
jgi:ABC-type uncharacterized transport system permease subunit